jgi:mRNA interferase HigB
MILRRGTDQRFTILHASRWLDIVTPRIQLVCVRIVKEAFLVQVAREHLKAARYLETWRKVVRAAGWLSLPDLRRTYPSADTVRVKSGRQVIVFNVCGNDFRLIVAMHFDRQIVYTLRFMTHVEYSKEKWKDRL